MTENALAPTTIKGWLKSGDFHDAVMKALPKHMKADRFIRVALTAIMKTPKLAECSQESMLKCMLDLSALGLEPDGRRAHLIPYRNNKKGTMEATLIVDFKGLIELSKRSGEVANWRAGLVCEADEFSWENGVISHKVNWLKPRGEMLAVYSHVRGKDGTDDYEVMTLDEVSAIRQRSKSPNNGPWVTDFGEMAKKSVMRRHSKRLTLSPEFVVAVGYADEQSGVEIQPTVRANEFFPEEKKVEIEEVDPKEEVTVKQSFGPKPLSDSQIERLFDIANKNGIENDVVAQYVNQTFGCAVADMTKSDYVQSCKWAEDK